MFPQRLFTPAEANKTLPFVSRVIRDIIEANQQISDLYTRLQKETIAGGTAEELEERIRDLYQSREDYLEEIAKVGCEFKDYQLGLVDFPARIGERVVSLCWRLGEPEVRFWHELKAGYPGRQSIEGHVFETDDGRLVAGAPDRLHGASRSSPPEDLIQKH